jgi:glycosyltransferase involved in cell wall biosynthesis
MILGLLPAIRGGLGELGRTGQDARLLDGYVRPYAAAFEEVRYFSYLSESLSDFTSDPTLLRRVRLYPGGGWHPWAYAAAMTWRYAQALRTCSVLRVFQMTGALPAVIARRRFGVPFVATYGFWYERLAGSLYTRLLRRAVITVGLAAADAVICTTPELATHARRRVRGDRVHIIPNGVDTTLFTPMGRPASARRAILYVGRLSREKNLSALVEAAAKLAGRFDVALRFIGDGPMRTPLADHAESLGVAAEFTPVVEHRRLPAVFARADVFVLPSFTEGHPKVLLEAMSCGVPCVASDVGGNRAILVDGVTGLLFDLEDPGALAEALARILGDGELAAGLGAHARAEVQERYDLGLLVAGEIELLRSVAAAH